jgi:propanediol dehydratase small subunit
MSIKQLIQAEIEKVPEEELREIYELIREYNKQKSIQKKGALAKIKQIKINGPEDFISKF